MHELKDDPARALGAAEGTLAAIETALRAYRHNPAYALEVIAGYVASGRSRIADLMPYSTAREKEIRDARASQQ